MILILSCSFYLFLMLCSAQRVSVEKFLGRREQKKHQDREIAPINLLLHFMSGGLEGALGVHPGLTSREHCTKSTAQKLKTFLWRNIHFRKNTSIAYLRKFQPDFMQKNFVPRSSLGLNHPCLLTSIQWRS